MTVLFSTFDRLNTKGLEANNRGEYVTAKANSADTAVPSAGGTAWN
jgi:hypothetical protein